MFTNTIIIYAFSCEWKCAISFKNYVRINLEYKLSSDWFHYITSLDTSNLVPISISYMLFRYIQKYYVEYKGYWKFRKNTYFTLFDLVAKSWKNNKNHWSRWADLLMGMFICCCSLKWNISLIQEYLWRLEVCNTHNHQQQIRIDCNFFFFWGGGMCSLVSEHIKSLHTPSTFSYPFLWIKILNFTSFLDGYPYIW